MCVFTFGLLYVIFLIGVFKVVELAGKNSRAQSLTQKIMMWVVGIAFTSHSGLFCIEVELSLETVTAKLVLCFLFFSILQYTGVYDASMNG